MQAAAKASKQFFLIPPPQNKKKQARRENKSMQIQHETFLLSRFIARVCRGWGMKNL